MQTRRFRQPFTEAVETVGLGTIWWALFSGPFYYWKKGALIEGTIMGVAAFLYLFVDPDTSLISPSLLDNIDWVVWGGFVLFAPLLMAMSYRRRGWVEITDETGMA
jgi:hypothetical protein